MCGCIMTQLTLMQAAQAYINDKLVSSLCVCLVYQWQCQFAAAAADDDDDNDDKVANDAVTVWLVASQLLVNIN